MNTKPLSAKSCPPSVDVTVAAHAAHNEGFSHPRVSQTLSSPLSGSSVWVIDNLHGEATPHLKQFGTPPMRDGTTRPHMHGCKTFPTHRAPAHLSPLALTELKEQAQLLSLSDVAVATCVCELHDSLESQPDLTPSCEINSMFTQLVNLASDYDPTLAERVLANPDVQIRLPSLCNLCARGEYALENHWYERVVHSADAHKALQEFPYYRNYEQLTQLEVHSMLGLVENGPRQVLFIGSGPLPLTSLLLTRKYGMQVDNIDIDSQAVSAGARFAERLGVKSLTFEHATVDTLPATQLAKYDAVYIAALAGLSCGDKDVIFRRLAHTLKSGALILARSAHLLRKLLYPAVSHADMHRYFRPLLEVHPYNEVVNSVLIGRKD